MYQNRKLYSLIILLVFTIKSWLLKAEPNKQEFVELKPIPSKIESRLVKEFNKLEVQQNVPLIDLEVFSSLQTAFHYTYMLQPAFDWNAHLRMDRWQTWIDFKPKDLLDSSMSSVSTNLKRGLEVLFIRTFNSKKESAVAVPYTPWRIPFTADTALNKLNIGDLVALKSYMNLLVGAGKSWGNTTFSTSLATHYLIRGEFQIHIIKKNDYQIRLKFILTNTKSTSFNASGGLGPNNLEIIGIKMIDRKITKIFDVTQLMKIYSEKNHSKITLFDYELDLRDPSVAQAYDHVMNQFFAIKSGKLINPIFKEAQKRDLLISDLTILENLFEEQKNLDTELKTINRLFKGQNIIPFATHNNFKIGIVIFNFSQNQRYSENLLTYYNHNNDPHFYQVHSFEREKKVNGLFSLWEEQSISRTSLILDIPHVTEKIENLTNLYFEWEYRDKNLSRREYEWFKEGIRQNIPEEIFSQIPWHIWHNSNKEKINARLVMNSVLNPNALSILQSYPPEQMYHNLISYIKSIPRPTAPTAEPLKQYDEFHHNMEVVDYYSYDLTLINHKLSIVFDHFKKYSTQERIQAFSELRFNDLFIEIGIGFLIHLLPQESLSELFYLELSLVADNESPFYFNWGETPNRDVYNTVRYIQAALSNNPVDLLLQYKK